MDITVKSPVMAPEPLQWSEIWPGDPDPSLPRVLVIPDLHVRLDHAAYWLAQDYDQAIFLGDYFDAPEDTADDARRVALWLQDRLPDGRLTFLLGNHDVHYAYPRKEALIYPGYTSQKAAAIRGVLKRKDWGRMRLACMAGSFLASHAGYSPIWTKPPTVEAILARCKQAEERLSRGVFDPVFGNGEIPGGAQKFGGPLAMDFGFFLGIPGVSQIVGHTSGDEVRVKGDESSLALCIDVGNAAVAAMVRGDHVEILRMPSPVAALTNS